MMGDRGLFQRGTGPLNWSIRYADATGKMRKEKAGTKGKLYIKRKNEAMQGKKLPETLPRRVIRFSEIAADALAYSQRKKRSYRDDKLRMNLLLKWFGDRDAESIGPLGVERSTRKKGRSGRMGELHV
jgi:hypothetical protein